MSKKLTEEEILKRFKQKHGDFYDYRLMKYKNQNEKIKIICPKHGIFEQTPKMHFNGQRCPKCAKESIGDKLRKTIEQFIKEAREKHGDFYDYSLVDYKKNDKEIKIICPKHGIFEQRPINHILGERCPKCAKESTGTKLSSNSKDFIKKAKLIHGDKYDYSLVDYKRSNIKVKIICPKHGIFEQLPNSHLKGRGCKECQKITTEIFIKRAQKIHGNFYDYSLTEYKSMDKNVTIICPKHGVFNQNAGHHIRGANCPFCNTYKGEEKIRLWLERHNINFEKPKKYPDLKDKQQLSYDFYIEDDNLLIEYNGEQHYNATSFKKGIKKLKIQLHHDWLKRKYAKDNNINLLIIPYWQFDEIEDILSSIYV